MDAENWELRYVQLNAARDADQAERRAVLAGTAAVEDAAFDERVSSEFEDEIAPAAENAPEWEVRDIQTERLVGGALEEVERRRRLMKGAFPFTLNDGQLTYQRSGTGVYEFCLAASLNPTGRIPESAGAPVIFEWISRDVLVLYVGTGSEGFRTGWPSHRLEKRERGTVKLFRQLQRRCGEFAWRPKSHLPRNPKPRDVKDMGLDIVVWKPFTDERMSCLFALGQCACGRTDWENKLADLSLKRLQSWFEHPTVSEPMRFFLVPFHIPNHSHLKDVAALAGVVLDRARIVMLAEESEESAQFMQKEALLNYHKEAEGLLQTPAIA